MMIVTVMATQPAYTQFQLDALVTMACLLIIPRNVPPHWLLHSMVHRIRREKRIKWQVK